MKLPNGDRAIIDPRKLTEYCLSPDHDDGKHKARLFQDVLGIAAENAQLLLDVLQRAAVHAEAVLGNEDTTDRGT